MPSQLPHRAAPGRQRGAALLTAMIIVTLVATLASGMVWQQWRAVQVESAERARTQASWILSGALDFARLILREDKASYTSLNEPWATPLAEARLSTFLAADAANADDGPEAFLSGYIEDAQARFNISNLLDQKGAIVPGELATLKRLCTLAGIDESVATRLTNALRDASAASKSGSTGGSSSASLMPRTVAQLNWLGVDDSSIQALQPYVVLIPDAPAPIPINVNTASAQVLAAAVEGLDAGTAAQIVQTRVNAPFKNTTDFLAKVPKRDPAATAATAPNVNIRSDYFIVHGRLRLVDRVLTEESLVRRTGRLIFVMSRERVATVEQAGS